MGCFADNLPPVRRAPSVVDAVRPRQHGFARSFTGRSRRTKLVATTQSMVRVGEPHNPLGRTDPQTSVSDIRFKVVGKQCVEG